MLEAVRLCICAVEEVGYDLSIPVPQGCDVDVMLVEQSLKVVDQLEAGVEDVVSSALLTGPLYPPRPILNR
ncbi:hypothetical protein N7540_005332 [Penicillium herquei]|nr:hypothetical protein N7540_005332 [Penicillium herquei]